MDRIDAGWSLITIIPSTTPSMAAILSADFDLHFAECWLGKCNLCYCCECQKISLMEQKVVLLINSYFPGCNWNIVEVGVIEDFCVNPKAKCEQDNLRDVSKVFVNFLSYSIGLFFKY